MEILEELKMRARDVRLEYIQGGNPNRRRLTGNVAVARLILSNGGIYQLEGTSKTNPMNRPVENPAELTSQDGVQYTGPKKHFQAYRDEDHSESALNDTHAEYKLFNALVDILESANFKKELTGTLYLYTEREMCSACEKTSQSFQAYFEKNYQAINIYVSWIRPYRRRDS